MAAYAPKLRDSSTSCQSNTTSESARARSSAERSGEPSTTKTTSRPAIARSSSFRAATRSEIFSSFRYIGITRLYPIPSESDEYLGNSTDGFKSIEHLIEFLCRQLREAW